MKNGDNFARSMIIAFIICPAFVCLFVGATNIFLSYLDKARKERIEADIKANLYPGLTFEEAEKYLTDKKIDYSVYEDGNMVAVIRNNISMEAIEHITIDIYFNSDKKIDSVSIDYNYIGW